MSEYANLYCGTYEIADYRNGGLPPYLFTEDDKTESAAPYLQNEDEERGKGYQYRSTARLVIERLELAGFSLRYAEEAYEDGAEDALEGLSNLFGLDFESDGELTEAAAQVSEEYKRRIAFHREVGFEEWLGLMGDIIGRNLPRIYSSNGTEEFAAALLKSDPKLHLMLDRRHFDGDYYSFCFMGLDSMAYYRAVLEAVPPETPVVLDYSYLVGWIEPEAYEVGPPPKIVILTEGSSDARILEATLRVRYPHLREYYSFLDFEQFGISGSAGQLLNTVRAFVGAGINQRMVAIFDNDAAGYETHRHIGKLALPPNIKAILLPDLPMATAYPTIGPQGDVDTDINGRACSLEMYLGTDVLTGDDGKLIPVAWKTYMEKTKRYQGEILLKKHVQEKYLATLGGIEAGTVSVEDHDWSAMDLLWKEIFQLYA